MTSQRTPRRLSSTRRQVVAEIVRLITPAYPALDEPERARVNESVTGFVTSQIEALPPFLGVPYGMTITAFELLAILRFGRRFLSLHETAKEAYLSIWSDAKIGPARDFIKLIRSCAVLAHFDHPDVMRRLPAPGDPRAAAITGGAADAP